MSKATKKAIAKRHLKKKAKQKSTRAKEVKRLRHLGWPDKSSPMPMPPESENTEPSELEQRITAATSMKALYKIATEYGIPRARDYNAVYREDLEAAILDAAKVG